PARDPRGRAHRHAVHPGPRVGRDAGPTGAPAVISRELARRAQEIAQRGEALVTATVVRVQHPTSVEPGDVALVREDGTIEGFVGGVCAQHSVRLYSLKVIDSGEPLLLRILPEGDVELQVESDDGAVTVQNPCLSGGAIEIFLEPQLPAPRV